jgi:hypothetical protein
MNQEKIDAKVAELKAETKYDWIALSNTTALTRVDISDPKNPSFSPASGYPVLGFVNTTTGEVRIFSVQMFL